MISKFLLSACVLLLCVSNALATDNYEYGDDEYVTISKGMAPDGKYAITAHGGGEDGYDNFHLFLTDAIGGKKIGPLEEVDGGLDTGADAYAAKWSKDSQQVVIVYRISRHEPLQVVSYRIAKGRAFRIKGPVEANKEQTAYWRKFGAGTMPSKEKTFGTPKASGSKAQ